MSITVNPNLYAGRLDTALYMAQITTAQDVAMNLFHIRQGHKDRMVFNPIGTSAPLQNAAGCALTPNGSTTIKNFVCELANMGVYVQLCKSDLIDTFWSGQMPQGVWNDQIPADVLNAIVSEIAQRKAVELQTLRWLGDTTSSTPALAFHDGILTQLRNLGAQPTTPNGYVQVTAAGSITTSNVVAEMQRVINAMPIELEHKPNLKLVVSPEIGRVYRQAISANLAAATWGLDRPNRTNSTSLGMFGMENIEVVVNTSFASVESRTMVLGRFEDSDAGNLILATDALSDFSTFKEGFNKATIAEELYDIMWKVRQGVAVKYPNEIVVYEP